MFKFFRKNKVVKSDSKEISFDTELTAAVLAYEIARIDGSISEDELNILMDEIKKISKKVNKKESDILKIIEIYSNNSVSFYEFVEDINKNFSKNEKLSLIEFMWKVSYADGKLDIDEEKLIRRLADLIKIKDVEVLKLKDTSKN